MSMKRYTILASILLISFYEIKGQAVSKKYFCEIISEFMNSQKVANSFRSTARFHDSTLIIVDPDTILNRCKLVKWRGYLVALISNGEIADSSREFDANYLFKNRCEYYILNYKKINASTYYIQIRHGCTNHISSATIWKKKNKYFLGDIENGVL